MAKLTLSDLTNLNNPTSAISTINANNLSTETAMEKTLSRDGTAPNEMNDVLDMNSNQIINLPEPNTDNSPVRVQDLQDILGFVGGSTSLPLATQAQAEAGVSNEAVMSPLRTTQLIEARFPPQNDTNRLSKMVMPTEFSTASATFPNRTDIVPIEVPTPGIVRMSKDIGSVFEFISASGPNSHAYVANWGSDLDPGTDSQPFETLQYAIADDLTVNIHVWPGYYDPFSFRQDTSTAAGVYKRIYNRFPGQNRPVYIGNYDGAPVLSSATWSKTGGRTNVYETTLSLTGSMVPHRVVYQGTNRFDAWGYPNRLRLYDSVADLDAAGNTGEGWYFDSGTGKIYLNFFGLDIEVQKAKFRGLFTDTSGNARIFLFGGVNIAFIGQPGDFVFDGVTVKTLNATAASAAPTVGLQGVTIQFPNDHGLGVQGGFIYSKDVRIHAPLNDCFNYNPNLSYTQPTFAVEHNVCATMAGDVTSFPAAAENKNGSSAHGGSNVIRAGGFYADNLGPNVVDTTDTGYDSLTWNVGIRTQASAAVSNYGGIQNAYSVGGTRKMWNDTCSTIGEQTSITSIGGAGAVTYYTNCDLDSDPSASGGASIATYTRDNP